MPIEVRTAIVRRAMEVATAAIVATVVIGAAAVSGVIEGLRMTHRSLDLAATGQVGHLAVETQARQQKANEYERREQWADAILEAGPAALPGYVVAQLGRDLPPGLVLTEAVVARDEDGWKVTLQGTGPRDLEESRRLLSHFEERLTSSPLGLRVTQTWRDSWMHFLQEGGVSSEKPALSRFTIEGRMQ